MTIRSRIKPLNDGEGPLALVFVVGLHDYCVSSLDLVLGRLVDEVVTLKLGYVIHG